MVQSQFEVTIALEKQHTFLQRNITFYDCNCEIKQKRTNVHPLHHEISPTKHLVKLTEWPILKQSPLPW